MRIGALQYLVEVVYRDAGVNASQGYLSATAASVRAAAACSPVYGLLRAPAEELERPEATREDPEHELSGG